MDAALATWLVSADARPVLDEASSFSDPSDLRAGELLRRHCEPDQAAAALNQVALRRRAVAKFGPDAAGLFFTADGLEQATRAGAAAWRAERFAAAGVNEVVDVACGLGADARAFADAGLRVTGIEADPVTAVFAQANLGERGRVVCGRAEDIVAGLLAPGVGVFVDPARRTARGRSWQVRDLSPSWEFCLGLLEGRMGCVKAAPGLDRTLIPTNLQACWVSDHGDLVELSLWNGVDDGGHVAVLLPSGKRMEVGPDAAAPVGDVGAYLLEPDPALIRSGAVDTLAARLGAWRLAPGIAYLSANVIAATSETAPTDFARVFEVSDVLAYNEKTLRAWIRRDQIGILEIKARGVDVDPATLRRRLKPSGPNAATLILTPTPQGVRAVVARRRDPDF